MAIPPQDRIQIQTVVREALVDSVFLSHPLRREPPLVFHLSSFRVHEPFDLGRCSFDGPEMYLDMIYWLFLNAQYACVMMCTLEKAFAVLRGLAFAACLPTTLTDLQPSRPKYSQLNWWAYSV